MEVVNENCIDIKLKTHSTAPETNNTESIKLNGDVNGDEDMEVGEESPCNGDSNAAPESEGMDVSENGVDDVGETCSTDQPQLDNELDQSLGSESENTDIDFDLLCVENRPVNAEQNEESRTEYENEKDRISEEETQDEMNLPEPNEDNNEEGDADLSAGELNTADEGNEEPNDQIDEGGEKTGEVEKQVDEDELLEGDVDEDDGPEPSITLQRIPKESSKSDTQDSKDEDEDKEEDGDETAVNLVTPAKDGDDEDEDARNESTPEKTPGGSKKKKPIPITNVTPRRSSRNLNKTKSYNEETGDKFEEDLEEEVEEVSTPKLPIKLLPSSGVEIKPAVVIQPATTIKKNTIVVNDTKRLAEIAAGSKANAAKGGKKEPTLVIINTNTLLANKSGAVSLTPTISPGVSVMPVSASSQNIFAQKAVKLPSAVSITPPPSLAHKAQVTPISLTSKQVKLPGNVTITPPPQPPPPKPQVILPSLTDDMFVVEAPSFIVPYVYEKPPVNDLKEFNKVLGEKVKQEQEEKRKKEEEEDKIRDEEDKKRKEIQQEVSSMDEDSKEEKDKEKEEDKMEVDKPDEEVKDKKDDEDKMEVDEKKDDVEAKVDDKESADKKPDEAGKDNEVDKEKEGDKEGDKVESDKEKTEEKKEPSVIPEVKQPEKKPEGEVLEDKTNKTKSDNYFENPLGKFFMQIGINLVQEHVQADLLKNQIKKKEKDGSKCSADVHMAISALTKTLEVSKENNKPFAFDMKKCQLCNFKTESNLVMAHHLETPHMKNFIYRCNFCELEVRSPHDILFHMEAEHNVRGRLDRSPAFHQCPNCPFEDNQKGKLSRHLLSCAKKYKPERNQEPPLEWEPPAKIPRVRGARGLPLYPNAAGSLAAAARLAAPVPGVNPSLSRLAASQAALAAQRGRGRPPIYVQRYPTSSPQSAQKLAAHIRQGGVVFRPTNQPPVLLPTTGPYSLTPSLLQQASKVSNGATNKILQQPSISITPLPRAGSQASQAATAAAASSAAVAAAAAAQAKPGRPQSSSTPAKNSFVICEICDGYIKDLEQLRNHMQWIHKVKIHPKMIYNRPPLNCQKCQFRFFTDQGLERHLLGSHGLVTSSMQEAANKGKDGGRCPVCGRVYQWKLLNHVARDHSMSLKPAHLSYKCTVCTATFGMYKQFENHVYSAHSVVAKRVIDKTKPGGVSGNSGNSGGSPAQSTPPPAHQPSTSNSNESMLKPLKINDEITIIPQPARAKQAVKTTAGGATVTPAPPKSNK